MIESFQIYNRERQAILQSIEAGLMRPLRVLYMISGASAVIYLGGWLRINYSVAPIEQITAYTIFILVVTATAGLIHAASLPAVAVSLWVERVLDRKKRQADTMAETFRVEEAPMAQHLTSLRGIAGGAAKSLNSR